MNPGNLKFQQVAVGDSMQDKELMAAEDISRDTRIAYWNAMQASLLSSSPPWPHDSNLQACPYPMLVPQTLLDELEITHILLSSAVTNIVERWWTDEEAGFPKRMPLENHEENVLRWMASQSDPKIHEFRQRQGSWRPDFLLDKTGAYRICEINGRFAFNGYLYTSFGQQAHIEMDSIKNPVTVPATRPKEASHILSSLLHLFDISLPLHLLKGEEAGLDIHLFSSFVYSVTGRMPILISPSDLQLVPDAKSKTGFALYCRIKDKLNGKEELQQVFQIGLELHQRELRSLSTPLLREISSRCFNDLRTIFLVHDKRMLGIVLQELNNLVEIQKVLTSSQAGILRRSIVRTIIPGSPEIAALSILSKKNPAIKDEYILKPIRSGKGAGIIFGYDMTETSWKRELELLRTSNLEAGRTQYVVQQKIEQPRYNILLHNAERLQRNYLVGTYLSIHGRYIGLGIWRTSPNRICAVSHGGTWICSVLPTGSAELSEHSLPLVAYDTERVARLRWHEGLSRALGNVVSIVKFLDGSYVLEQVQKS